MTRTLSFILAAVLLGGGFLYAAEGQDSSFVFPQYSKKVTLDFKNADIKDALKIFAKQIGVNFVINEGVQDKKITVYLDNVPVEEALEKVLSANGMAYDFDASMDLFTVKASPVADEDKPVTRVFHLRYATVDSSQLKKTTDSSSGSSSSGSSASGASSSGSSSGSSEDSTLVKTLSGVLTDKGKIVDDARTNSLVITDVQGNFPAIERLIARLDVPVKQVLIQVEMLDVSKSAVDQMGAKFNLAASFSAGSKQDFFPFNFDNMVGKSTKYTAEAMTATPGLIDFSGSTLALKFLKSQADTRSLARPRIVTNDNETASIQLSSNEAIGILSSTTAIGSSGSSSSILPERAQTGVWMTVTPQVNELTNEITLVVLPRVVDANSKVKIGTSQFANTEERSVKVSLRVPSGKTIVIGGLLRRASSDDRTSVPFLGSIPLLGAAFRSKDTASGERELIIFLTPTVLDTDQETIPELKKDLERKDTIREPSSPNVRNGLIDIEMDRVNSDRKAP
jgi:type IV pilus assembly protein PilQ